MERRREACTARGAILPINPVLAYSLPERLTHAWYPLSASASARSSTDAPGTVACTGRRSTAVTERGRRQLRATCSDGHCVVLLHATSDAASSALRPRKYQVV